MNKARASFINIQATAAKKAARPQQQRPSTPNDEPAKVPILQRVKKYLFNEYVRITSAVEEYIWGPDKHVMRWCGKGTRRGGRVVC